MSKKFDSVFKKYKLTELPGGLTRRVSIDNELWYEVNYLYVDGKTKKPVHVMQVIVWFEGKDPELEKMQPKIKNVRIKVGKEIIDRKNYLTNLEFHEPPQPAEN